MNYLVLESGQEIPLDERIAITKQANDLTETGSVESDYSTEFTLADSVDVRRALGNAQAGTSASDVPYTDIKSALVLGGVEVVPRAITRIEEHEEGVGFRARVYSGNKRLFLRLADKRLRDLDLSELDHEYYVGVLPTGGTDWHDGLTYDLYDRGHGQPPLDGSSLDTRYYGIWPSAYVRYLWEKVIAEAGFRWEGDLPASFDRMLLPSVKAFEYSEETRALYRAKVGLRWEQHVRKGEWGPDTIPYAYHGSPFKVGASVVWDDVNYEYVVRVAGYHRIYGSIYVAAQTGLGTVGYRMDIDVNGSPIVYSLLTTSSTMAPTLMTVEYAVYQLYPGDRVRIRLRGERPNTPTTNPRWFYPIYPGQFWPGSGPILPPWPDGIPPMNDQMFVVELLSPFPVGGLVRLNDWVPDLSCVEFMKSIMAAYGLTQTTHPFEDLVMFRRTAPVLTNAAQDWSVLVDRSQRPRRKWQVGSYTQHNWFRWLEDEANPPEAAGLGDGELTSPAGSNEEKEVIKMPYAASAVGGGGLLLIPNWKARPDTSPVEYDTQTPKPRLVLMNPDVTHDVMLVDDHGGVPATMTTSIFVTEVGEDLDFVRTLLPTYWAHLAAVLRRPLALSEFVRLTTAQVTDFDPLEPVWLATEGHNFYVNRIVQHDPDQPSTEVELLRLTPGA